MVRAANWSEAVAVGSSSFVNKLKGEFRQWILARFKLNPVGIHDPKSKIQN
jgi:hypothetical protein